MKLSICSPCLNERRSIAAYVERVEQAVRRAGLWDSFELIVADGLSTDGTREWLAEAAQTRPWLKVVDNPVKRTPSGRNAAIKSSSGDRIAIVDVHWELPPEYFEVLLPAL